MLFVAEDTMCFTYDLYVSFNDVTWDTLSSLVMAWSVCETIPCKHQADVHHTDHTDVHHTDHTDVHHTDHTDGGTDECKVDTCSNIGAFL